MKNAFIAGISMLAFAIGFTAMPSASFAKSKGNSSTSSFSTGNGGGSSSTKSGGSSSTKPAPGCCATVPGFRDPPPATLPYVRNDVSFPTK